ncbi:MAG: segregation/condensation protein A [Deltaproteobacteria bacterium]|nr:segregation/condensation protein A [Deltaproteobacteria bacterium]
MSTQVQLEIYEGPLDLLLHLIKKNEVSITDIPIASITEQYLATLDLMQSLNLDVAGEFLVMAATLIHIKSKMLLPPEEDGEADDDEDGDPRDELVRRLLEYERFKDAAEELQKREILRRDVFVRPPEPAEEAGAIEFERVSLFDLLSALRTVLERFPGEAVHEVVLEKISVREKMTLLLDDLRRVGRVVFQSLFEQAASRLEVVVMFLALLELVKIRAVRVWQEERLGPITIELAAAADEIQEKIHEPGGVDDGA